MLINRILFSLIALLSLKKSQGFCFGVKKCYCTHELTLTTKSGTILTEEISVACTKLEIFDILREFLKNQSSIIISKLSIKNCTEKSLHRNIFFKDIVQRFKIRRMIFDCPLDYIDENYFEELHPIEYLFMYNLIFNKIPAAVGKLKYLKHLVLTNGELSYIGQELENLTHLIELDLSYNKIQIISKIAFINNKDIEYFNFNYNKIKFFYPETFHFCEKLNFIEVKGNGLEIVKGLLLKASHANLEYIDIANNNVKTLPKSLFSADVHYENINLEGNPWICDCRLLWIHAWYKNKILKSKPLICHEPERFRGKYLTDLSEDDLTDMPDDCPPACSCTCIDENENYFISVNCSAKNLTQFPDIILEKVIEIDLHGNRLTNPVHFNYGILSNLRTINLENNFIKKLDFPVPENVSTLLLANNEIERFFSRPPQNVSKWTLGANPWTCDCETIQFRKWMLSEKTKITDINLTRCNIESSPEHLKGRVIVYLSEVDLCPTPLSVYIIIIFTIMSIVLLGMGSIIMYYRYQYNIKVWLYSRGFTFLKKDFEQDREKIYDAFVSSADEDFLIVRNFILPELEDNPPFYSLFEPRRNMKAGEMFQHEKEMEEIQKSKRVIVLLSEYYMNNNFLMGIFKFAFDSSLEEKVYRLILITVGDLPPLSDDNLYLKAAMESKQCLRYGERMIREKLLFAMPEKKVYNDIYQNLSQTDDFDNDDDSLLIP